MPRRVPRPPVGQAPISGGLIGRAGVAPSSTNMRPYLPGGRSIDFDAGERIGLAVAGLVVAVVLALFRG